jgi:hypothetical protein
MFRIKKPLVRWALSPVLIIGLVTGAHEALAQNAGAMANPAQLPNAFNSDMNSNQNSNFNPNPFQNPYLFVNPPNLVQPSIVGTPSVSPNAIGITDPLGNPYPFLNPNPITNPNVVTSSVTPSMVPSVTPNSSTLPNQGIGANPTGTMPNLPNTTGTGIVGGVAPSGGAGNPSGVGGRELDQIVE